MTVRPDHIYAALTADHDIAEIPLQGDEQGITDEVYLHYRDDDTFVSERLVHQYHVFVTGGEKRVADWVRGDTVPEPLRAKEDKFYRDTWIVSLFTLGDEVRKPDLPMLGFEPYQDDICFDRIVTREQWLFEQDALATYQLKGGVQGQVRSFYGEDMLVSQDQYRDIVNGVWNAHAN